MPEAHAAPNPTRCQAHNRKGAPCGRMATPGHRVCYFHGGAPGSGAPAGNQNARRHGYYSRHIADADQDGLGEAGSVEGLSQEIALLRLLIGKHAAGKADLLTVAKGVEVLTRAVRAQHAITDTGGDPVAEAVARVLRDLGGQMGLQENLA